MDSQKRGAKGMTEEVWKVWGDARPTMNTAQQRKVLDYVKERSDAGLQTCLYSREAKKKHLCKITTNRCYFGSDYPECDVFCEFWLEAEEGVRGGGEER